MKNPASYTSFLDELHARFGEALECDLGMKGNAADVGRVSTFAKMMPKTFNTILWLEELRKEANSKQPPN